MKEVDLSCTECGGTMTEGFLVDENQGGRHPVFWVEGAPRRSVLFGTKLKGQEIWVTESYRCESCGFLKSYARKQRS